MEDSFESVPSDSLDSPKSQRNPRSLSPGRSLSSTFDFESHPDPLYKQAMKKISDGCARFSKERDGMLLTVRLLLLLSPSLLTPLNLLDRHLKELQWIDMFLKICYDVV